jgi:hypothetical protein
MHLSNVALSPSKFEQPKTTNQVRSKKRPRTGHRRIAPIPTGYGVVAGRNNAIYGPAYITYLSIRRLLARLSTYAEAQELYRA